MFLTFSSPSHARSRRRVRQACENCRLFRVRCNGQQPCARCQSTPRRCIYSSNKRPAAYSPNPDTNEFEARSAEATPTAQSDAPATPPAAASPEFASRINDYFTSISELVLHSPPPQYSALSQPSGDAQNPQSDLSNAQRSALLRLFARRLHPFVPVVDLAALSAAHEASLDQRLPPLVCAAIALAIQHAYCSSLSERMLGLGLSSLPAGADASLAGYELITRCRAMLAAGDLELDPSLADVQCHVLMSLFLINAGHLKPAYSLLGSAVRMAYSLHLHRPSPSDDAADLHSRIWWTLVQLDHKCSALLRRPAAFHWSEISCPLPSTNEPAWSYHSHAVALTAAILAGTHAACAGRKRAASPDDAHAAAEAQAKTLADTLAGVRAWERSLRSSPAFAALDLDPDAAIARLQGSCTHSILDPAAAADDDDDDGANAPAALVLQRTLLKIHYHNTLMTLFRSSIRLPFRSIHPLHSTGTSTRGAGIDANAAAAVLHALALAATVAAAFRAGDLLCGLCDVYHAQWNAVLTLTGFILSYPLSRHARTARMHFPGAVAVFDTAAGRIAAVGRLAAVGRDLCGRVDRLVRLAEESLKGRGEADSAASASASTAAGLDRGNGGGVAGAAALPEELERGTAEAANALGEPFASPPPPPLSGAGGDAGAGAGSFGAAPLALGQQVAVEQDGGLLGPAEQDLWSWMDVVSLPSWPDYQHGIDELFTDIADLDILMDESWAGWGAQE